MIRSVLSLQPRDSGVGVMAAHDELTAEIIGEVTTAICEAIFIVPPDEVRRSLNGSGSGGARRGQRRRSGRRRH